MTAPTAAAPKAVVYPESDGKPIADNTLQFEWIERIKGGLDVLFADRDDVFIAADLLWYPVEGDNRTRNAPDALVAFGRPKGHRGSYLQWREEGIAPQVVFEVLSPGNRTGEMNRKREWYDRYGVEEYYCYDPDRLRLTGWIRPAPYAPLSPILHLNGWVSPLLGIRFVALPGEELEIYHPDGTLFHSYLELATERDVEQRERQRAEAERDQERAARERLEARLRSLGIDPDGT